MPFDLDSNTLESVKKTNRLVVLDEDVPGGARIYAATTEKQGVTIIWIVHPSPFQFRPHCSIWKWCRLLSKPSAEDAYSATYNIMQKIPQLS